MKLFYKKPESDEKGQYADKGVGFLHIKKLDCGGYQLLVRAQSTLGNVLLNIRLGERNANLFRSASKVKQLRFFLIATEMQISCLKL